MKNLIKYSLLCLSLTLLWTGCLKEHLDLDPIGNPSGGVIEVEVEGYDGNEAQVRVRLFAVDHFGDFLDGLTEADFIVEDFNSGFGLTYDLTCIEEGVSDKSNPYSAMMLFDQSGSISGTDPDDARVIAGMEFTKIMSNKDEGGVAAFASGNSAYPNELQILEPFTKNRSKLRKQIQTLLGQTGGGTPLYRSIFDLIPTVGSEAKNDGKALIVFTDGDDTDGGVSISQIIDVAQQEEVEVYTVGLSLDVNEQDLTRIAHNTGGAVMFAEDALQLISLYSSLGEVLRGSYQYYDLCVNVIRTNGVWSVGNEITFQMRLELPGGEMIVFPVYTVI